MASVQSLLCKGKTKDNNKCTQRITAINGFCYQHQQQCQSNFPGFKPTESGTNQSGKARVLGSTVFSKHKKRDSPFTIFDENEDNPNPPASTLNSSSSADPEVQREFGHDAIFSAELCQEGAQRPVDSLSAQSPSASEASAGIISSAGQDTVADRLKQTSLTFKTMDEDEQNRILVYIPEMLGKNPHNACAEDAAVFDAITAQDGYVHEMLLESAYGGAKRAASSSATTGEGGEGEDKQTLSGMALSDQEYELLLSMIITCKKWIPDLLDMPDVVPAELLIQSRDHIQLIAACFTGSLPNVQALYPHVRHSESLPRQMLSIAALRNHEDLAVYCMEQGARLDDPNDIYDIQCSIITGKSFRTCKLLVTKGLDINVDVEFMGDILSNAVNCNHLAWVKFCLENGADPNLSFYLNTYSSLATAARYASIDVVSLLLKHRATLKGSGALALAARRGNLDMVKFLIKKGAFIDEECVTSRLDTSEQHQGGTALHLVSMGRVDILKYLLESGANPNLTDHQGRTPLEKFLEIEDMEMVGALKGALSKAQPKRVT